MLRNLLVEGFRIGVTGDVQKDCVGMAPTAPNLRMGILVIVMTCPVNFSGVKTSGDVFLGLREFCPGSQPFVALRKVFVVGYFRNLDRGVFRGSP